MNTRRAGSLEMPTGPPESAGSRPGLRPVLLLSYGVVMGLVTTALGALASSGVSGQVKLVTWIGVTTFLAAGAVWIADTVFVALLRSPLRREQRDRDALGLFRVPLSARQLQPHQKSAYGNEHRRTAADTHLHQDRRLIHPDVADRSH